MELPLPVVEAAFAPDGSALAYIDAHLTVHVVDPNTLEPLFPSFLLKKVYGAAPHSARFLGIRAFSVSARGGRLAFLDGVSPQPYWVEVEKAQRLIFSDAPREPAGLEFLRMSLDGTKLFTRRAGCEFSLWEGLGVDDRYDVSACCGRSSAAIWTGFFFLPGESSSFLVAGASEPAAELALYVAGIQHGHSVGAWASLSLVQVQGLSIPSDFSALQAAQDFKRLLVSGSQFVEVWQTTPLAMRGFVLAPQELSPRTEAITGAALSANGEWVAVASEDRVHVFEVGSGRRIAEIALPAANLLGMASGKALLQFTGNELTALRLGGSTLQRILLSSDLCSGLLKQTKPASETRRATASEP